MKFLPFEKITYRTKLDSEEILNRIWEIVEPKKTFRMTGIFGSSSEHKPYEGSINGNSFSITRIIGYRNSFLPIIKGNIEENLRYTKVNVKMRLHISVFFFMSIWLGGVGIACIFFLASIFNNQEFEPAILIPFGMFIFGYVLLTGSFKYESIKSKKFLAELFEAEIEE